VYQLSGWLATFELTPDWLVLALDVIGASSRCHYMTTKILHLTQQWPSMQKAGNIPEKARTNQANLVPLRRALCFNCLCVQTPFARMCSRVSAACPVRAVRRAARTKCRQSQWSGGSTLLLAVYSTSATRPMCSHASPDASCCKESLHEMEAPIDQPQHLLSYFSTTIIWYQKVQRHM
jgi:hypothetical protein